MMIEAPFHAELAEGPAGARAFWISSTDNLRLRVAHYPGPADATGTVLMFPGRTEYAEKYGRVAADLADLGFHTLAIDWRGQGLADRMLEDRRAGHVNLFRDYQHDVAAMLAAADRLDLPRPLYMIAHSMGAGIGLRALIEGLPVAAAGFTGPMWGIRLAAALRPAAWALGWSSARFGLGHMYAPSTGPASYVATALFDGNLLTRDRDGWAYMQRQVNEIPELQLGGPSMRWLHEALGECLALARLPAPQVPAVTFVGSNERIVDVPRIASRMAAWPGGALETIRDGEHEVLMEDAVTRGRILSRMASVFEEARTDAGRQSMIA
ncbi:MAG: alpha/beta hydrolase [Rhodobacteraceae bacterium]|jgi:lysophospholipase|uniref:Lysophospholipase n=1 Tax=Salipiger profundus TaxID=1229727 RepID=A0A1U7D7H7_9RHOB|nr:MULTISPECIES: alpha/beta hydrolase [Salipiger]APX24062.1 lysophospholipase [Salipiger profundus]MAB06854.1 alpha/beta hydrolase [Paracoccaceae bacterium]GFZ94399.1 hydrolase [Salipiger profundus]SFB92259.1 lysophospholipase [Salipiger profundus]